MYQSADVYLRSSRGPLLARAYWPARATDIRKRALLIYFRTGDAEDADRVCRDACAIAGVVVLMVSCRSLREAATATEWAADHARELGADPTRLLITGRDSGAELAAAVALYARDRQWPEVEQLPDDDLIYALNRAAARLRGWRDAADTPAHRPRSQTPPQH